MKNKTKNKILSLNKNIYIPKRTRILPMTGCNIINIAACKVLFIEFKKNKKLECIGFFDENNIQLIGDEYLYIRHLVDRTKNGDDVYGTIILQIFKEEHLLNIKKFIMHVTL